MTHSGSNHQHAACISAGDVIHLKELRMNVNWAKLAMAVATTIFTIIAEENRHV